MSTSLPRSVRNAWGEEPAEDFERWMDTILSTRAVPRDEYREVLSRLDVLDNDVAHLRTNMEERFEEVDRRFKEMNEKFDHRFEQVDQRFSEMNEKFDHRFEQVDRRFKEMNEQIDHRFEQVDRRFEKVEGHLARMDQRLDTMNASIIQMARWTVGTIVIFGTLITLLIAIAEFF